jgi:hypothetical protein
MTRLVSMLVSDLAATGAGLAAGFWAARRVARAGGARPVVWPWLMGALAALALDTFATTFPTLAGRLPLWVERYQEPALWALALAFLAFGVAFARWPRRLIRVSPFLLIILHAALSWPIASFLRDTRRDGMSVQNQTSDSVPGTAANLLRLYGVDASERDMADLFGTTIRGTSPVGVIDGLARLGMHCETQPVEGLGMWFTPAFLFRGTGLNPRTRLAFEIGKSDEHENLMHLSIACDADPGEVQRRVGSGTYTSGPRRLLDRSATRACPSRASDEHFLPPLALYVPGVFIHRAINLGSEYHARRRFSEVLRSMNEPSLSCGHVAGRTYRFLWLPAFHPQVVVSVDVDANGARMTTTAVGHDGSTVERLIADLDAAAWQALETEIVSSRIEELASTSSEGMGFRDGVIVVFEARAEEHYKLVYRSNPLFGPSLELGRTFLRLSRAKSGEVLLADYLRPFTRTTK